MNVFSIEDQKQYSLARLKQLPRGNLYEIKEIDPIQIDNLNGYEIVAKGKSKDGKEELVYQVMLFENAGDYFIIVGMCTEQLENTLKQFKSLAKTFKRK